jgi:hypothetical protein
MDTESSPQTQRRKNPWEILGVERGASWEDIRAAFLKKARRLHPDKGGDRKQFQELRSAYESLRDVMDGDPDADTTEGVNAEVWEEIEKWVDWAGRWGKRLLGRENKRGESKKQEEEVLRIRVPWKLLEDRTQSVRVEYDGWPIRIPLGGTETIGAIGLRVRLVPQAEYKMKDMSGNDVVQAINADPWRTDVSWLFDVPSGATGFRVCGGEWQSDPGEYGRGVFWRHAVSSVL